MAQSSRQRSALALAAGTDIVSARGPRGRKPVNLLGTADDEATGEGRDGACPLPLDFLWKPPEIAL
jgi:hypothetical protein